MSGLKQELGLAQGWGCFLRRYSAPASLPFPLLPHWWLEITACGPGPRSFCWSSRSLSSLPSLAVTSPARAAWHTSSIWHLVPIWNASPAGCSCRSFRLGYRRRFISPPASAALFGWHDSQLLLAELGTLAIIWWVGSRGASSSANLQTLVAVLIVALIVAIWWRGGISPAQIPFRRRRISIAPAFCRPVGDVLVFRRP